MKIRTNTDVRPPTAAEMHAALDAIIAAYDREIAELTHDLCARSTFRDDRDSDRPVPVGEPPAKHDRRAA